MVEGDGSEQAKLEGEAGSEPLEDLPGAAVSLMGVGADEVAVELVGGGLGEEVGAGREGFDFEELVFDEAVDGLDIALVSVSGWGGCAGVGSRRK